MGPKALMKLKYAIYDGLEMRLKVTKTLLMSKLTFYGANDDDRWNCPCVLCPVSSWFLTDGPEMSPNVTFAVLQHVLCSFPLLNGMERSQFHYIWQLILKWSWKESKIYCIQMILKEVKIKRVSPMEISMLSIEGSPWRLTHYNSNVMVLKGVNVMLFSTVHVSDGLERSQFCLYTWWSWKEWWFAI